MAVIANTLLADIERPLLEHMQALQQAMHGFFQCWLCGT